MGSARFTRRARLANQTDFAYVFAEPVKSSDLCFTVLARSNTLGFPRLGLAVSRKAAKSAVARNRIKRVIRESFRHHQPVLGGIDIVVIGRANLAKQPNAALFASLERHWARLARACVTS